MNRSTPRSRSMQHWGVWRGHGCLPQQVTSLSSPFLSRLPLPTASPFSLLPCFHSPGILLGRDPVLHIFHLWRNPETKKAKAHISLSFSSEPDPCFGASASILLTLRESRVCSPRQNSGLSTSARIIWKQERLEGTCGHRCPPVSTCPFSAQTTPQV